MTTPTPNDGWETIDVPRGTFYGWSSNPNSAGKQRIIGEVMQFSYDGGTDFNGHSCPQLSLIVSEPTLSFNKQEEFKKIPAGELVVMTCGTVNLANAVLAANLKPGDTVMITLTGFTQVDKGTAKQFDIKVKRGSGKPQNNQQRAATAPPQQDPWGNGAAAQQPPQQDPWTPPHHQQQQPAMAAAAPPPDWNMGGTPSAVPANDPWGAGVAPAPGAAADPWGNDEPPF